MNVQNTSPLTSPQLNIITALACEARPLIDYYKLQQLSHAASFQLFTNSEHTIRLCVSGVGKIKAAAATAYCYAILPSSEHSCFLNVGIAGSGQFAVAESVLANKIIDAASKFAFYPWISKHITMKQAALTTFDQQQANYQCYPLIDMEAYGFFCAATHLVTKEQIQVVKIVSDNDHDSLSQLNKQWVVDLVSQQINKINTVVNYLLQLSKQQLVQLGEHPAFNEMRQRWHFTTYQQHQLKEILRRWQVIYPQYDPLAACVAVKKGRMVLQCLLDKLAVAEY